MKFLVSILVIVSLTGCSAKEGNVFKTMKPKSDIESYKCYDIDFVRACSDKVEGFYPGECGVLWGYDMTKLNEDLYPNIKWSELYKCGTSLGKDMDKIKLDLDNQDIRYVHIDGCGNYHISNIRMEE